MKLKSTGTYFIKNDQPYFLNSGEIHYFRLNPDVWEKHLSLLKEAGCRATSTYIPWDWHEYRNNQFDFTGKTDPARDLVRYVELCRKTGLDLILKPGPYILAEYKNQGLPQWLIDILPKRSFSKNDKGEIISEDILYYLDETYLQYVFRWYDQVMPIIGKYQTEKGGPVIMMQVCNEIGVFQWLSGYCDYNESLIDKYRSFLENKYLSIENLNERYKTSYGDFGQITPPKGNINNREDYRHYYDFHLFFRKYYNDYFQVLVNRIRSYGINIQLTHNIPGWIYGNASELPMMLSTYSDVPDTKEIAFGLDHIPEFISFRNAHSDLACNRILSAARRNNPVWAAEFQCGSREYFVKNYTADMELFYFSSLAHGLKGLNYYMFSQGKNPVGKGFFGKTFYHQTALDYNGEKLDNYEIIKKVSAFLKKEEKDLLESEIEPSVGIGLYFPHFYTELVSSQLLKKTKLNAGKIDLNIDPRYLREEILFNGLLRALQTANIPYAVEDLRKTSLETLLSYKQLWVCSTDFMDKDTQERLALYVKNGGNLIIYPLLPTLDAYLNKERFLMDELGIQFELRENQGLIKAFHIDEIYSTSSKIMVFPKTRLWDPIAFTETGETTGISVKYGQGRAVILGFAFSYTTDEHEELYDAILKLNGIQAPLTLSDKEIQYVIKKSENKTYLFVFNYHNQEKEFTLNGKKMKLPPFSYQIIIETNKHGFSQ